MTDFQQITVRIQIELPDGKTFTKVRSTGVGEKVAPDFWKALTFGVVRSFGELRRDVTYYESRKFCLHPTSQNSRYACKCHEQRGNDFWFLPINRCLFEANPCNSKSAGLPAPNSPIEATTNPSASTSTPISPETADEEDDP